MAGVSSGAEVDIIGSCLTAMKSCGEAKEWVADTTIIAPLRSKEV